MKGRDALREMLNGASLDHTPMPPKRSSGAVRAMNLELQQLSEDAAAGKALRQTLAGSEPVVELNPGEIDASPVTDRIPTDHDAAYDQLKAAIADKGQQVPILVRPTPGHKGRFQIAYGRRRLRAAQELGRPVKAIIRQLSDRDLIIAQAQENGPRADLTFIERALFASNLLNHGFDKDTIAAALDIDKPELSRLLTVATAITPARIAAIGPAPKIGRPRWLELAERCSDPDAIRRVSATMSSDEFQRSDSNARFNAVLGAAIGERTSGARKRAITTAAGQRVAWLEQTKKGFRLSSEAPAFAAFLEERLPSLLRDFEGLGDVRPELTRKEADSGSTLN